MSRMKSSTDRQPPAAPGGGGLPPPGISSAWKGPRRLFPILGSCVLAALLSACTAPRGVKLADPAYDFGPFAAGFAGVDGSERATVAGPFFETARGTNAEALVAVRPFYGGVNQTNNFNRSTTDLLWPVAQDWDFENQSVSRFLFFMSFNHDTASNSPRHRLWLPPFWFSGRDAKGTNYWALFPLYGSIHEFLGRDTIDFVLWPIRSTSTLNDLETSNWLWPVYSETTSKDGRIHRHRLFPFYSYSYQRDHFTKRSVLWPVWSSVKYDYPDEKGGGWILFPVCGRMKTGHEKTLWVVPPLFRFSKGPHYSKVLCPWPFIQVERGKDYRKTYVWPLWGNKKVGTVDSTYYAWPIVWDNYMDRGQYQDHLVVVAPFYRHYVTMRKGDGQTPSLVTERQEKLWPLMNYRHKNGTSQFRTLDLWPFAENEHVDLNWAPLWTLYDRTWTGDKLDSRLLWGLYRHQRRGDEASYVSLFPFFSWRRDDEDSHFSGWSFLKGLVGREKTDHGASWQLLYFLRLGNEKEKQP